MRRDSKIRQLLEAKPAAFLYATAVGLAFFMAVALLLAVVLSASKFPINNLRPFAVFALLSACYAAGVFIGFLKRQNGWLYGAVSGLLSALSCFTVSCAASGAVHLPSPALTITAVLIGCIGGIRGVNIKKH